MDFKYSKHNVERARNSSTCNLDHNMPSSPVNETSDDIQIEDTLDQETLKLASINITNFKGYNELKFDCHEYFNLIIGENNIGKSTIFDAFLLWEIAYKKLITSNSTFYKTSNKGNFIVISSLELSIFRVIDVLNIYNDSNKPCVISLDFKDKNKNNFKLSIEFEIPEIHNNFIKINIDNSYEEFIKFHKYCQNGNKINIRDVFSIRLSQPVANIIRNEQFLYKAQLKNKSNSGYAFEVLRNKILNTSPDRKFTYLEERLCNILGREFKIRWKNINKDNDVNIKLTIQEGDNKEVDLALVGSGVINLLEIFSSLYMRKQRSNILLLDEPDSHIHSEIQSKLISELKQTSDKAQIFIISHNDRLIHTVEIGELFYINQRAKNRKSLKSFPLESRHVSLIQREMAGSLLHVEKNQDEKPVLFVEGATDVMIIKAIIKKIHPNLLSKIKIRHGNGHSWVANMIIAWHFFDFKQRAVGLFDHDNATLKSVDFIKEKTEYSKGRDKKPNFEIHKLKQNMPQHLRCFFKSQIKLPFAIEEMFDKRIWKYFSEKQYLLKKEDIIKYNDKYTDTTITFEDFCGQKNIPEANLIYLNKVNKIYKIDAAKYIVQELSNKNTDAPELEKLITKITDYLLPPVVVTVFVSNVLTNKDYIFARDLDEKDYYLHIDKLKKGTVKDWNNLNIDDKIDILVHQDSTHNNGIPAEEIYIKS